MRIPTLQSAHAERGNLAMTPMIDVVFLLLIFFVCASTGQVRETLLPTDLPSGSVESAQAVEQEDPLGQVWLKLFPAENGRTMVELNDHIYDNHAQLKVTLTELAALAPEIPVFLDIQGDVPLGDMIEVYDLCRSVAYENILIAIDANGEES